MLSAKQQAAFDKHWPRIVQQIQDAFTIDLARGLEALRKAGHTHDELKAIEDSAIVWHLNVLDQVQRWLEYRIRQHGHVDDSEVMLRSQAAIEAIRETLH